MKDNFPENAPPWGAEDHWQEVNRTVAYLIQRYGPDLGRAQTLAHRILSELNEIFPIMDRLSANTCPWCPDPCCLKASVWIDFRDLLFLHLSGQHPPPAQLLQDLKKKCAYIGNRGCTLPRCMRPWACTWYMCPTQTARIRKMPRNIRQDLERRFAAVKAARKEMEDEFVRVVSGTPGAS